LSESEQSAAELLTTCRIFAVTGEWAEFIKVEEDIGLSSSSSSYDDDAIIGAHRVCIGFQIFCSISKRERLKGE